MTTILKSGQPLEELLKKLEAASSSKKKGVDAKKYSGVLKTEIDPLAYQKQMRDQW